MLYKKTAFQLRLDGNLHVKTKIVADKEMRSLNAQIEYFIAKGIEKYERENGEIVIDSLDVREK